MTPVPGDGAIAGRFAVGRVVAQAFAVFMRHPMVFASLGILLAVPDIAFSAWYDGRIAAVQKDPLALGSAWAYVGVTGLLIGASAAISIASYALTQAAVTIGLFDDLRGGKVTFVQCLRRSLPAWPRLLALSLLLGAGSALAIGAMIAIGIYGSSIVMLGVGVLVFAATLFVFTCWWAVVPAVLIEASGAFDSFQRSLDLTRGNRWRIFALIMLPSLIAIPCVLVLARVADESGLVYAIVDHGLDIAGVLASAMLSSVGYIALRAEQEGFSVDDVADVFD